MDVLAPHAESGTANREVIDGVSVERFRYLWPQHSQTVCYHGGALVNLRKSRKNVIKLPALVLAEWTAVFRRLASRRYDLLHSHWILPQGFIGVLAAKPLRIPHVLTVHGGDVFALKGGVLARFKRFSLKGANAVTVNSSVTRRAVEGLSSGLPNLNQIPMGVSTARVEKSDPRVHAIRDKFRGAEGPLLVFVGRVVDEKGVEDLIAATEQLRPVLPGVRTLIVGEGQDRERFEKKVAEAGLTDWVSFVGWVQPSEVPVYLAAGDIFVGPSRTGTDGWVEAQGLTFIEAMIAGTPVVATRSGGIVDSVVDEETGLLVKEESPAQIAAAVQRLHTDAGLRSRLVATAYDTAVSRFSRAASARSFSTLFAAQLADRRERVS